MAFWGAEVRPGRPYTHCYNPSHGRLRICQATLGSCDSATRTVVQCIVGKKAPIILCSLNPKLAEMCHLEIELEEDDEVLFAVLGQSAVHLSGYYLRPGSRLNAGEEDSESYGEDVGESDDSDGDYNGSDDSYESDFIDDGEVEVPEDNCASDSMDDGDTCPTLEFDKQASEKNAGKVKRRRPSKKYLSDSADDNDINSPHKPAIRRNAPSIFDSGSEDEDDVLISVLSKKNKAKVFEEIKTENVEPNDRIGNKTNNARKRKGDSISQDPATPLDLVATNGSSTIKREAEVKKKSKKNKRTSLEADEKHSNNIKTLEDGLIIEDLSPGGLKDADVASDGSKVYIRFVGKLLDGKIVESNVEEKRPYKFKLGVGKVIRGWDLGISGMRVGDKRRLTVPPSMRLGNETMGKKVPENATIIYEIDLMKVR